MSGRRDYFLLTQPAADLFGYGNTKEGLGDAERPKKELSADGNLGFGKCFFFLSFWRAEEEHDDTADCGRDGEGSRRGVGHAGGQLASKLDELARLARELPWRWQLHGASAGRELPYEVLFERF